MLLSFLRSQRAAIRALPLLAAACWHAAATAGRPDPTNVDADVPPLKHQSALQRYRPLGETPLKSWRAANEAVARIGGWRAYLREATAPEATPASTATPPMSSPSTTPTTPMPPAMPHHGHHGGKP
ncbi:MAG: hypothetical protein H6933_02285 [Burkholderiaceae bacterium]|nr:hypothetical protein [Rhodoferax sp.]MCP5283707.1 hypothetical protein [Burkholderiaceae bacterium]